MGSKTGLIILGGLAAIGLGYLTWRKTIGKKYLGEWLLKRWKAIASNKQRTLDWELIKKELEKLTYADHELLARYTKFNPMEKSNLNENQKKRLHSYLKKMSDSGIWKRANLNALDNIVFPG